MNKLRLYIALVAVTFSSVVFASDRSILFLQQETPGHIIYVSLNEKGSRAIVSVEGLGASKVKEQGVIPIKEFENIWDIANSKSVMKFKIPEGAEKNMADPKYYTVNIGGDGKSKVNIQIPVTEKRGVVGDFVKKLKKFIPAKS